MQTIYWQVLFNCNLINITVHTDLYVFYFILFMSGLDECFIKLNTIQQILAATGRDGNNDIYSIAFGVVEVEDTSNWCWFLTQAQEALGGESEQFEYYTFTSDRQMVSCLQVLCPSVQF